MVCLLLLLVLIAVACGCALATFATAADAHKPVGILQSNSSWRKPAHSVVQLPNFTMVLPAGTVGDDFVFLGHGSCINQQGERFFGPVLDYASTPRADGTSPECTKLCQMVPSCSGYEVRGNATWRSVSSLQMEYFTPALLAVASMSNVFGSIPLPKIPRQPTVICCCQSQRLFGAFGRRCRDHQRCCSSLWMLVWHPGKH